MEYTSFYGGRRGASFVIVKNYKSIAEMVAAFKQGGSYKTVNYDEYVLIDTENKNDKDNGKIYRRGYDYNNSMGGAEYEGQIVGPAGMAPHTEMHTIEEVESMAKREGFEYRRGSGSYGSPKNLVPGKYNESGSGKEIFNDEITWAYCSVRDVNSHESTAHIGFKFPYTVIDYIAESVDAYYNRSNNTKDFINKDLTKRIDDMKHPFYEKWQISVPKGIKGNSLDDIKLQVADTNIQDYEGKSDDIANQRKVLTYVETNYDTKAAGDSVTKYIGKVNEIEKTAISSTYHLLVYYSDPARRAEIVAMHQNASYEGKNDWHDLGYIGYGNLGAIVGKESNTDVAHLAEHIPPYSAWLIVEEDGE